MYRLILTVLTEKRRKKFSFKGEKEIMSSGTYFVS